MYLLTRPQTDSDALAAQLAQHGKQSFIEPMLTIHPEPFRVGALDIAAVQALLLTSKHSLIGADTLTPLLHLPVLAVGDSTARAARNAGFMHVTATGKHVRDMVAHIKKHLRPSAGSLLYFSGRDITTGLSAALPDFRIQRILSYHAQAASALSPELITALTDARITRILFFSSRTARAFESCLNTAGLSHLRKSLHALCLSKAAAASLHAHEWNKISISVDPSPQSMLALALAK